MSVVKKIKEFISKIGAIHNRIIDESEVQKVLIGNLLAGQIKQKGIVKDFSEIEFKVFSQWGDDGIIQYLIQNIDIPYKTFIEFGVESYIEANTRFLLLNDNWSGLIMDGSAEHMNSVRKSNIYWRYDLQVKDVFITKPNVNQLIASSGFDSDLGILHIDIDGNDYWIWKEIDISPIIVIVEYNSLFGFDNSWSTPYSDDFYRTKHHYSNICYGSSLLSLCDLAEEKGYDFVGCNSAGNNAYFVRKDKTGDLNKHTAESGYRLSKFKEGRAKDGSLTYIRDKQRFEQMKGALVYNTRTNQTETL